DSPARSPLPTKVFRAQHPAAPPATLPGCPGRGRDVCHGGRDQDRLKPLGGPSWPSDYTSIFVRLPCDTFLMPYYTNYAFIRQLYFNTALSSKHRQQLTDR